MKECPKCGTVYTDVTLSFCLSDGTQLIARIDGKKTEKFSNLVIDVQKDNSQTEQTQQTNLPTEETIIRTNQSNQKRGVSPIWIVATFGLLGLLFISVFSVWLFSDRLFGDNKAIETARSNSNYQTENSNLSSPINNEKVTDKPTEKPTTKPTVKPTFEKTEPPKENFYRVVGVKSNDVLYIRPQAGNLKVKAGSIPPNATGIKLLGGSKKVGKNRWVLIKYNGTTGWVNSKFIARQK